MRLLHAICLALFLLMAPSVALSADMQPSRTRAIHSIEADFIQKKELPILAKPLLSRGRFCFQAPDSLRWEYTAPIRSVLLLHGGETHKFVMEDGRWHEVRSMAGQGLTMMLGEMTGWLRGDFNETQTFSVRREDGLIHLVPKQEGLRGVINEIILRPGKVPGLLDAVTIIEGKEATTTMIFKNARLNQPLAGELFRRP